MVELYERTSDTVKDKEEQEAEATRTTFRQFELQLCSSKMDALIGEEPGETETSGDLPYDTLTGSSRSKPIFVALIPSGGILFVQRVAISRGPDLGTMEHSTFTHDLGGNLNF